MITENEVEAAAAYMRDNAAEYAKAKAERCYLQEYRKSLKALLASNAPGVCKTVQAKEGYAYSHNDYLELLDGYKAAVEQEEFQRWRIEAAKIKIEIYRTQQANNRLIDNSHR